MSASRCLFAVDCCMGVRKISVEKMSGLHPSMQDRQDMDHNGPGNPAPASIGMTDSGQVQSVTILVFYPRGLTA